MYIDWESNFVKRLITSIFIVAGIALAFLLRMWTVWIFDAIVLLLAAVAVYEIAKTNQTEKRGVSVYYIGAYVACAYAMFVLGITTGFAVWLHLLMQVVVLFVFALYTLLMNYMDKEFAKDAKLKKQTLGRSSAISAGEFLKLVLYPTIMLLVMIPLNHLGDFVTTTPVLSEEQATREMYKQYYVGQTLNVPMFATLGLLMIFAISCLTDTFAFCVGRILKGKKLCPKISPKKTISGAVGGLFGGVLGSLLVLVAFTNEASLLQSFLTEKLGGSAIVLCLFIAIGIFGSVITQMGDIYASIIKRRAGIKDFGKYLAGHGGAMDRLDGISWNSLFIFIVFFLIALIP